MSRLNLTAKERRGLRRQLAETLDARILRRTLAVSEFDQGRPVAEIADMLGVTRQSVYNWIEIYRRNREPAALEDKPGRGRPRTLDEDEERLLETFLADSPQQFGRPEANWTVALLGEALEIASGQRRSENTLRRALARLEYVWKRPRYDLLPDPEGEKKKADSPPNTGSAAAQRGVGPGRNRLVDVPAAAGGLGQARQGRAGLAQRPQRAAGDLRGAEPAHGAAAVCAS